MSVQAVAAPLSYKNAVDELSSEMSQCSAFFAISAQCFERYPDSRAQQIASQFRQTADSTGIIAKDIGKTAGVSQAAIDARLKQDFRDQSRLIKNSCINLSVIQNRYGNFCKRIAQDPVARLDVLKARRAEPE